MSIGRAGTADFTDAMEIHGSSAPIRRIREIRGPERVLSLPLFLQIEFGDAKLAFELADFFQVDRADDVDDRKFLRFGGDDRYSDDVFRMIFQMNVNIGSAALAVDADDLCPARLAQLRTDGVEVAR